MMHIYCLQYSSGLYPTKSEEQWVCIHLSYRANIDPIITEEWYYHNWQIAIQDQVPC
jgi:hypothetical protein